MGLRQGDLREALRLEGRGETAREDLMGVENGTIRIDSK